MGVLTSLCPPSSSRVHYPAALQVELVTKDTGLAVRARTEGIPAVDQEQARLRLM